MKSRPKKNNHLLIFEGAELVGKSHLINQVYNFLEKKYNQSRVILDGCFWFNADVGIFGTLYGQPCIKEYLKLAKILKTRPVIFEKFHLSDIVYNQIYHQRKINYQAAEKQLLNLGAKIILCTMPEDEKLLQQKIKERLALYPHYQRILQEPAWYFNQQKQYLKVIETTILPHLILNLDQLPNPEAVNKILSWIGEINPN